VATDVRKHLAPIGSETPRRQAFNDLSLSICDLVPVANTTARTQLVSDLTAAGYAPSATHPLYVFRADATAGHETEYTRDGTTWQAVWPVPAAPVTVYGMYVRLSNQTVTSSTSVYTNVIGTASGTVEGGLTLNAGTGEVTVPIAGQYLLNAWVGWGVGSAVGNRFSSWAVNNVRTTRQYQPGHATLGLTVYSTKTVRLAANDRVAYQVMQSSGQDLALDSNQLSTGYEITRIGP